MRAADLAVFEIVPPYDPEIAVVVGNGSAITLVPKSANVRVTWATAVKWGDVAAAIGGV